MMNGTNLTTRQCGFRRDAAGSIRPVPDIHDNTLVAFVETCGRACIAEEHFQREEAA